MTLVDVLAIVAEMDGVLTDPGLTDGDKLLALSTRISAILYPTPPTLATVVQEILAASALVGEPRIKLQAALDRELGAPVEVPAVPLPPISIPAQPIAEV